MEMNGVFRKAYGKDISGMNMTLIAVQVWAYVLNKAGSTDPKVLQKTFNTVNIPGKELLAPGGGVKFDSTGQNMLISGLIGQYQLNKKGEIELEIVYPFEDASSDLIYPFAGWK
jgi:branched-chain amino acid transport system substrate-binding protein